MVWGWADIPKRGPSVNNSDCGKQVYLNPSQMTEFRSLSTWKFWKLRDIFDADGPSARSNPTARRGRKHLEFSEIFIPKVTGLVRHFDGFRGTARSSRPPMQSNWPPTVAGNDIKVARGAGGGVPNGALSVTRWRETGAPTDQKSKFQGQKERERRPHPPPPAESSKSSKIFRNSLHSRIWCSILHTPARKQCQYWPAPRGPVPAIEDWTADRMKRARN